jgi:hypothetical protein
MANNGFEKAQMDPGTIYRLMMQARQARSDSIHYWAVVFLNNIAFGAASLSAALRSVFAKRIPNRAGLHVSFARMSNSASRGSIR